MYKSCIMYFLLVILVADFDVVTDNNKKYNYSNFHPSRSEPWIGIFHSYTYIHFLNMFKT